MYLHRFKYFFMDSTIHRWKVELGKEKQKISTILTGSFDQPQLFRFCFVDKKAPHLHHKNLRFLVKNLRERQHLQTYFKFL